MIPIRGSTDVLVAALTAAALAFLPGAASAQEHHDHGHEGDPSGRHLAHVEAHGGFPAYVDIFFTHHAYLERKLHPRFDAFLADETRRYAGSGELVWQFGERFGAEIEAAVLNTDPDAGEGATGLSDVEVAPMVALVQDPARLLIVTVRSGFVLPVGDEDEGLGVEGWGWEPGLMVWKGFGPEKRGAVQTELGYERIFTDEGADEEELIYNVGLSYWLPSNWIPIVELNGATPVGDEEEIHGHEEHEEEEPHADRGLRPAHVEGAESESTLVSATVGFRYAFANGQQWGAGIQFPVNDTDAYDVRLVVGGIIHVP